MIPDNDPQGLTTAFTIDTKIKIESIELTFDAQHALRGDLEVILTSPDGTQSILAEQRNKSIIKTEKSFFFLIDDTS